MNQNSMTVFFKIICPHLHFKASIKLPNSKINLSLYRDQNVKLSVTCQFLLSSQSFVRLMDGKFPQTILTDLDMSLKEAVMSELPTTRHAFAPWYITSKLQSWFSPSLGPLFEKFTSEFNRVCNLSNLEEFSDQWSKMVNEFRLVSDRHVNLLTYNREYWTLPFLRGWFFGCLIGAVDFPALIKGFFKGLLSSQTRLRDFVEQVVYLNCCFSFFVNLILLVFIINSVQKS